MMTSYTEVTGKTSAHTGSDRTNEGHRGILVFVNVTAISASTVTVTVQAKDPLTSTYATILASAAISSTGLTVLEVYPGIGETANVSVSTVMPRNWRIIAAVGGGTQTYSISYDLIV